VRCPNGWLLSPEPPALLPALRASFCLALLTYLLAEMQTLSTLVSEGGDLVLVTSDSALADHHWQNRRRLVQLTGAQRLLLTIHIPHMQPLQLSWEPPPLPAELSAATITRSRRAIS